MTNGKKLETLEEIQDEMKTLSRKRDLAIIEADKIQKELQALSQKFLESHPDFIKIRCLTCGGKGYVDSNDGKKKICMNPNFPMLSCNGKGYIMLEKYKEEKKEE